MYAVVAPIIIGLLTLLAFAENKYATIHENDWKNLKYGDILQDIPSFLNQSELDLFNLTLKRYPGLIGVFSDTLSQVAANGSLRQDVFCVKMDIAIRGMNDQCKKPIREILRDSILLKACINSAYTAAMYDQKLSRYCQGQLYTGRMNNTNQTVSFSSNSFFYAVKVLAGTAFVAARRWCEGIGGTFEDQTFLCYRNDSAIEVSHLKDISNNYDSGKQYQLYFVGNSFDNVRSIQEVQQLRWQEYYLLSFIPYHSALATYHIGVPK